MSDISEVDSDKRSMGRDKVFSLLIFLFYALLTIVGTIRHELWGDELHSWNISRVSSSFFTLLENVRYEGHPPLWYLLLHAAAKIYNGPAAMQILHLLIVTSAGWLICYKLHISAVHRIMILTGYFFCYEYGILSRNYSLAVLISLAIVILRHRNLRYDAVIYYMLLFLLSLTHVLGLFLAVSLHFAFTIKHFGTWSKKQALLELAAGLVVVAPSLLFLLPPGDSSLGLGFWKENWSPSQFAVIAYAPVKAFLPVPAWWSEHSWNSHFLLELHRTYPIVKIFSLILSLAFSIVVYHILRPHRLGLNVFFINFFLTLIFAVVFPLTSLRYVGFIFIGFILAVIISYHTIVMFRRRRLLLHLLLLIQIIAAVPAFVKDLQHPFSQSRRVRELLAGIPTRKLVTDYWTLNTISAEYKRPVYCVGFGSERQYLVWNAEMKHLMQRRNFYSDDIVNQLSGAGLNEVFLATYKTREELLLSDFRLFDDLYFEEMRSFTGSIEKSSDLYLYRVTLRKDILQPRSL